jgi:hypothetical protein
MKGLEIFLHVIIFYKKRDRSRDILSKQVKMATFNGSEAAAGNDELYLAS